MTISGPRVATSMLPGSSSPTIGLGSGRPGETSRRLGQELLITVAIILVIAAISIPNLLRARNAANAVSAVASLR
jgi:hypothetical protein